MNINSKLKIMLWEYNAIKIIYRVCVITKNVKKWSKETLTVQKG